MSSFFCKRCLKLYYRNYFLPTIANKYFDFSLNGYSFHLFRFISNNHSTPDRYNSGKDLNLTYEKVDSQADYSFEDEYLYPEPFDNLENIPLNSLISFRNNINKVENVASNSEDISEIITTRLSETEIKSRNNHISYYLETVLREKVNKRCSVSMFGSAINGLWTDGSDLDVCVQVPNVTTRKGIIRNLRRIATVLGPLSPSRVFENRFTAKMPILHWKIDRSKQNKFFDPFSSNEGKFDLDCGEISSIDICVNNYLAVVNSGLIGTYVSFEPRVRDLILFLKVWARNRNLNNRSEGTLSSFSISLMLIHFLQNCNPPILPSLQDLAFSTNEPPNYVMGVDCRYSTDFDKIKLELDYLSKGKVNHSDNRTLLTNFFRYYGWFDLHSKNKPITIRSVDLSEYNFENSDFNPENPNINESFLHVDNPFEVGKDVATIPIHHKALITNEFRKSYHLLKSGISLPSLLNP